MTYYLEVNNTPKELQDFANLYQQKLGKHMGKDAKSAVVLGSGERLCWIFSNIYLFLFIWLQWVFFAACESPLDCKEIQPVHPKGDQFWVFTGRTDVEAETPVLWPPDARS